MRVTERDLRLVRDLAMSHVLSRDQMMDLGYFGSVTRVNTRLRTILALGLAKRLDTPFFGQSLYAATPAAQEVLPQRVAALLAGRKDSPRFLRHALAVTEVRIALAAKGIADWRFEAQVRAQVEAEGLDIRPDGLALLPGGRALAVEADMGSVSPEKFRAKLEALARFVSVGHAARLWNAREVRLLTLTTGETRARSLSSLAPPNAPYRHDCRTFAAFGIDLPGSWS